MELLWSFDQIKQCNEIDVYGEDKLDIYVGMLYIITLTKSQISSILALDDSCK